MNLLANKWQFYKDKNGRWQWRKYANNKVVAVSGDGFTSRPKCINDAKTRGYVDPKLLVVDVQTI